MKNLFNYIKANFSASPLNFLLSSIGSIAALLSLVFMGFNPTAGSGYLFIFFLCIFFVNIDKFAKFKASLTGIEGELRTTITKAETSIAGLRELALSVSTSFMGMLAYHGFVGSMPGKEREELRSSIEDALSKLGLSAEIRTASRIWDEFNTRRYVNLLIDTTKETVEGFCSKYGVEDSKSFFILATASNLEEYLKDKGMLTSDKKELLLDYDYFLKNHNHRRPDVFYGD